jgi:hypothetical protein
MYDDPAKAIKITDKLFPGDKFMCNLQMNVDTASLVGI